jgi:hypothetical protein
VPIDVFQDVRVDVKTLVVPEGGELPSDEELEAMEAAELAERHAAQPEQAPAAAVEYLDEVEKPAQSPAEAAAAAEPAPEPAEAEPEWRADAEAALSDSDS